MSANIVNGLEISKNILKKIQEEIAKLKEKHHQFPGLVTFLVGNNPASLSYITLKIKKAQQLGFKNKLIQLPENVSQEGLLTLIKRYNQDSTYHGILVQLPLPPHINLSQIIYTINPDKDVDGFHPINTGEMFSNYKFNGLYPCTPKGIIRIIEFLNINPQGKEVVILGRSNLVGKPTGILCLEKKLLNASVTILHSSSRNYQEHTQKADIVIACLGKANFLQEKDVKAGSVIIDVGVNKVGENPKTGKAILVGDVDFKNVKNKVAFITPVPGGVGPMTIAMLMENTLCAFKKSLKGD